MEEVRGNILEFWGGEVVFVSERDQAFDHEGFLDEGVCAGLAGELFDILGAGEIDDGDMAGVRGSFERFDGCVAPYAGHFVIHEDKMGIQVFDLFDQVFGRIKAVQRMNAEVASFEDELTDKQVIRVVVDKNDFGVFH